MSFRFMASTNSTRLFSSGNFAEFGVSRAEFGQAMYETMLLVPEIPTTAVEADAINFVPGVYGPNCTRHVWFTNNLWYFDVTVEDANGIPHSFDKALRDWLDGLNVFILDTQPSQFSVCQPNESDIDP